MTCLSEEIWKKKHKHEDDVTINDSWRRVAKAVASVEKDPAYWEEKFFALQKDFSFIPGGRISAGAGTRNNYLLNCAVLPIENDSIDGIYEAIKKAAVLAKCNYGVGFDFSALRPKNAKVSKGGVASGPVSFMKVFDASGSIIETGGGRRAATIGVLRVDHPDILEFISAKREPGVLTQFNISVGLTTKFLDAVRAKEDFDLVFKGEVHQTIPALDIWNKLVESAYNYNDPGIILLDEVNKYNNGWYLYDIAATNPCFTGDMRLLTTEGHIPFSELEGKEFTIISKDRTFAPGSVWKTGIKPTVRLEFYEGQGAVTCTADHVFMLDDGAECKAEDTVGLRIKSFDPAVGERRVKSVTPNGEAEVYDFREPETHWGVVEGLIAHNCGEIPLPPFGVCCLGSVNLTRFVKEPFSGKPWVENFDWDGYENTIATATRFLDNVLDVSEYPYPEMSDRARSDRRIGLCTVAGLGSTLAMLQVPYDSALGVEIAAELQRLSTELAYRTSVDLAKEKGPFPNFLASKYVKGHFIQKLPKELQDSIFKNGIRNLALLTIPPVGTGSLVAGNISNGLEPIFALEYDRKVRQPDGSSKIEPVEDYAWRLWKSEGNADTSTPAFFKTSREIEPKTHIDMQVALQHWIDGSISKTANIPESFPLKDYEKLMWHAIDSGAKGVTSFREGTREGVLEVRKEEDKKHKEDKIKGKEPKKKRPRLLSGTTYKISDDLGNLYITINNIEEKGKVRPFEIFIESNSETASLYSEWYKAISKLMSAVMRRTDDANFMVADLKSIFAPKGYFSEGQYMQSKPQMIGSILEEHIAALAGVAKKETLAKCPECGEMSFSKEGGCGSCKSCGFSQCG